MESESQYRALIEASPDVFYSISSDGKITSLNPAFEKVTGWKTEEWIGKPFIPLIHPEDRALALESFQKTLQGKPEPVMLRVLSKSGNYLIGEFISVPKMEDGKIVGELGIAHNLTNYKMSEEKLYETSKRLQALVQAIPDMIYFKDVEGRYLVVNNAFERFVGLRQEDIVGKTDEQLLPADLAIQCKQSDTEVLKKGAIIRFEEQTSDFKGGKRFLETIKAPTYDSKGKVMGIVGISRDVTERRLMEEKLQENEELFRSVVESSHDGIAIVNEAQKIVYVNNELTRIFGYPKEEIVGKDYKKFLAKDSRTKIQEILKNSKPVKQGHPVFAKYELKIVRKNGEKRDVEARAVTVLDAHGRMQTIVQVLDITESKKTEEKRKTYEKRLSELNSYAQKLNAAEDLREIYSLTLEAVKKTLGFEYASIFVLEEKKLHMVAQRGISKPQKLVLSLDGEAGITVRAAKTGKPVNVQDVRKDEAYVKTLEDILSELAVPMKFGKKVLGVLNVESRKPAAFSEEDISLLEILASHAAIAISNLRRRGGLAAINAFGRSLVKAKDLEKVCALTLEAMQRLLGFDHVSFFLVEGEKLKLVSARGVENIIKFELPLNGEKGITVKAVKNGKPVYVSDTRKDEAYVKGVAEEILSELAVPIKLGNKVFGALNVESHKLAAFDEDDIKRLEILAAYVAIALSNIKRQESLEELSKKLEQLIKSSTKIMQIKGTRKRLKEIAKTIQTFGWRKVALSLRDEVSERREIVTVGLTKEELKLVKEGEVPKGAWKEILGPKFEKYKIGEFYFVPWNEPWIRENIYRGKQIEGYMQDWVLAPLRTPDGRTIGFVSIRDPLDGQKPTKESLMPLELFLRHATLTIENAQLIENLEKAEKELKRYADSLEQKVQERTRTLTEFQDKLLKAQRLAVIGELAGIVGHDLRNPLTSISSATYYIKKQLAQKCDNKIMEMIKLIEKNIAYSNKIVNDLLEYSREIKLDITEANPKKIVDEALSSVEIPENIQVVNDAKATTKVWVDFEKMKRVFINLIRNAVEAMPNGGTLTVKSRKVGKKVEFTVSDTGVGMSEEVLRKLWSPLFTTKAKGMGFGLSICKRFVEAHKGSITVESTPGKGTTFTLTLPIEVKTEEGGEKVWLKTQESSLLTTTKT